MRDCTLLPGQVIVIADGIRLTVLSIQGDEVRFAVTPEDAAVALTSADFWERAPEGHVALLSAN